MSQYCRLLDWDTAFFGVRIAKADVTVLDDDDCRAIDAWCLENQIDCLYLLADPASHSTTPVLERGGFALKDLRVTLQHRSPGAVPRLDRAGCTIREGRPSDADRLSVLARESHTATRFFADSNFDRDSVKRLYETWLRKAFTSSDGAVLAAECDGELAGYVTCSISEEGKASIGLLAVAEGLRGRGIGKALLSSACEWFCARGALEASVVAQGGNRPAIQLYQSLGFQIDSIFLWYHKWYRPVSS